MDTVVQPSGKRPKLVWAVFLFYIFSVGYTALSFALIYSGAISLAPEQATYLRNLSTFDWAVTVLSGLLTAAAAIAIFLLRKISFYLFSVAFALGILQTLVHTITTNFVAAIGGPGAIGALIGYAILLAVCIYARRLSARGVLS